MYKNLKELGEEVVEGTIKASKQFPHDSQIDAFFSAQKSVENKVMLSVLVEIRDELYALNMRMAVKEIIKDPKPKKK